MSSQKSTDLCIQISLCWTTTVLEGLFGRYYSSSAALRWQRTIITKQPLVCDWSATPEPLLMFIDALLKIQRKVAHAGLKIYSDKCKSLAKPTPALSLQLILYVESTSTEVVWKYHLVPQRMQKGKLRVNVVRELRAVSSLNEVVVRKGTYLCIQLTLLRTTTVLEAFSMPLPCTIAATAAT